jgi:hypothetical protein
MKNKYNQSIEFLKIFCGNRQLHYNRLGINISNFSCIHYLIDGKKLGTWTIK